MDKREKPNTPIVINIGDDFIPGVRERTVWRQLFTGKDNRTYDLGRVLWFVAVVSYLILAFFEVYSGAAIDYWAYGAGLAGLLAGGGAALGFKSNSEPDYRDERRWTGRGGYDRRPARRGGIDNPDDIDSGEGPNIP